MNGSAVFPFVETSGNKPIYEDRESFELAVDPVTFLVKEGMPNNSQEDVETLEHYIRMQDSEDYQQRPMSLNNNFSDFAGNANTSTLTSTLSQ